MNDATSKAVAKHEGWSKAGVNLRLTKERRAGLRAIAGDDPRCAPTEAVDRAIDLALATRRAQSHAGPDIGDLADAGERHSRQAREDAGKSLAAILDVGRSVDELRELISAVAGLPRDGDGNGFSDAQTMREWLDQEAKSLAQGALLAQARWQSTTRTDDRRVALELLVKRVASAGQSRAPTHGHSALVRLEGIDASSALASGNLMKPFYLVCGKRGESWQIDARRANEDHSIGVKFASLMA